jgi:hypothetical protein
LGTLGGIFIDENGALYAIDSESSATQGRGVAADVDGVIYINQIRPVGPVHCTRK